MPGPHPAVAEVRVAVRQGLAGLAPGDLVLAACSGGADSLALAAALAFEGPRLGLRAGAITVDHGLQPGSAGQASRAAAILTGLGLDPVLTATVTVAARGTAAYRGREAAAREARYAALARAAASQDAAAVLLGHTLDDQAETVLLGLARGSGARSLAGMPAAAGVYRRPLLAVRRAQTRAACAALGLAAWDDPHNDDPGYARVRARARVLPVLEAELGPGIAQALARTAAQLRDDADALDALAIQAGERLAGPEPGWPAGDLAALAPAIRSRVLRNAALAAGSPGGALSRRHVAELDALVTAWHGQRGVDLPGGVRCRRQCGRLLFDGPVFDVLGDTEGAGGRD